MPTYQLEHALTGRTYKVRFDSDPTPEDIDHILAQFAEQDGFDPPTLTEMARERTKLTTLQKQAAIFPPLATAADTFMEALPVAGSVKQFISGSTDDPMRAGPSEIRRRLTASQERLANLQRGGRRFLESERASREDTGQGRFSSAFSAIPQEVLKAPGTAVKGFGDVAGAIVPSLQGNVVSQFGEAMNETAREWLPTNPAYQGEIQQKAAQAVGQGAASLAEAYIGGGAARAVGAGEKAITTAATLAPRVTGFLKGASQGEDIAKANQVTDPFARAALVLGTGGIESATEAIGGVGGKEGTQALLGRGIRPRLNAAGEVIASEAGEEMGAGLAQPLLERATITPDPARPGYSLGGQKLAPIPTSIDDAQAWLRSAQEQGFYGAIGAAVPGAIAGMRSQPPDFASVTEAPVHPATAPTTDAGSTPAAGTPSPTPSVSPSAPRQSLADIAAGAGRSPSPPLPVSASPRLPLSPGTYTGADAHTQITSTLATTAQDPDAPQGLRELDAELSQHDYTGITLEVVDDPNATVEAQGQRLPFTGYASHGTTPGTGTIGVNLGMQGRGEASPTDTVRHEALHFRLKREIERPSTPASQQALTGLTGLKDALAADPEAAQEFDYETGDLHEWISGIASSKPLRAKLAAMPASPAAQARGIRSMWDQFVAWVKQLVTGKPATQRTALDDALAHVLTLARTTRSTQPSAFRPPPSSTNLLPPGSPSTNLPRDARQPTTPAQTRAADPRAGLRANPQVRSAAVRRTLERIAAAHGAQVRFHQDAALPDAAVKHEKTGITLALSDRYAAALSTLSPEARRGNLTKLQVRLALENGYRAAGQASPKPRTPAAVAKDVMASLVHGYRREEGFAEETRRGFAAALSTLRRKPYAAGDTEVFLKDLNQVIREPKPFLDHLLRQLMELRATGRITEQDDGTFTGEPEWEARTVNQLNRFMVQAAAGTHGDTVQSIIMQSIPALDDSMIATEEGERNLASLPPATAPSPTLPSREDYLRDWIAREKQILRDEIRDIEARYRAERPNPAARAFQRAMSQRFVQGSPENTRFVALRKATRLHAAKLAQARDELRTLTDPAYAAKVAPHRTPEARAQAAADAWAHVRRRSGHSYDWKTHYLFDPITGQILEIPSAGVIADQIGAIAAGVKDLATFTTRLAQRFGDWIKPHARALWNAVKEATRAALMKALEKIGAIKFAVPYQEPSSHARAAGIQFTGQPTPPPFDGAQLVGTCVSEQQINTAFGDMDTFERLVQERGDEFTEGDTTVTYNPRTHEHFFWKHTDPASAPQLLPPSGRYPGRGPFKVENLVAQAQITGSPLPADFREILGRSNEEKAALKNSAARLARDLDAEMRRQVKLTSATRTQLESTVNNALDDPAVMTALAASNPSLHARVLPMRNMLDTLSTTVASWTSQTMGDTILGNLGSWLRRSYMAFDPSSGWSYDALVDAAAKGKAVLGQTPAATILRNARAFLQAQNPSATPDQITIQMKLLTDRQTWLNVMSGNKDAKVTKDVTSLIKRKDIPAPLRALMGEVRDPLARFGQSASFQAQFIARHEMQQRMRNTGLALGIFSPVQTPDHLVQVGGVDGAEANPVWSGFGADLWTTPQMLAALRNAKGVNTGTTLRDRILDTIAFIGGKSKEARVALSPDFYSTNIIGAVLALAGSGDLTLSQQSLRSMGKAMQTLWMARLDKTAVTPAAKQATIDAARDLVSRLESAGVLSSGVNMDELLASLTSPTAEALTNTKTKDRVAGAAQGALTLQGLGHTIAGNPGRLAGAAVGAALGGWAGMKNISKPHRALMEALVSTPDLFAKLTAYLNNRDAYLRSGLSAEDAHAKAVEVTRNTMPDYSKVPAFLRELSRLGIIGSFIAFRAESYRNLYWNARYAAQELRSGNPALMLRGAQRLMGIALSQSLAAGKLAGAFGLLGLLSDADDEEDQAYRRSLARKWDANAQLVYDKLDANGASYFSADYLVPQASAMQIIRAAVEGRSFAESMTAVASTIKEQAIGGNLVLQPLIEAYTNSKFEGNFPVSTKQGWEGSFDRALHVLETMEPGYASKAKKLVRAGTGMGLGRAEYTFTDEALRTLGLRMSNVKHEPQIRSKLSEFNARLAATRTSANAAWSNFGGRTLAPAGAKMRQDALDAANAERAQIKADFDDWLKDLSTLRISPQKVKSIGSLPSFAPLRVTKDGVTAAKLR